ncbi:MAG: pyridoxamine 5'-phosphate oxidase family protein, partial [Bdellovibrionales bacterium]|nr:pyridoxamine 5'-phosphate oxidase family protein [Massilia sp.]
VSGEAAKRASMALFMEKIAPGRQAEVRTGSDKEFDATTILRIALDEAACKLRSGPPVDDESDMGVAAWTGVLPLALLPLAPVRDPLCALPDPDYVRAWVHAPALELEQA